MTSHQYDDDIIAKSRIVASRYDGTTLNDVFN